MYQQSNNIFNQQFCSYDQCIIAGILLSQLSISTSLFKMFPNYFIKCIRMHSLSLVDACGIVDFSQPTIFLSHIELAPLSFIEIYESVSTSLMHVCIYVVMMVGIGRLFGMFSWVVVILHALTSWKYLLKFVVVRHSVRLVVE